ncbi:CLUMA_CG020584, isoform A [Clunio marinus]|uniref:CLUMA_CG020584, isoform A n=1 Tax=Clunio marinus TaxID=568069 RepID=A0A1J1J5D5_9DIPT|nr:CLUMA_CG020584, isoform A [Clunio marinus]
MSVKLILMLLLITNVMETLASSDYSYDDSEEIPDVSTNATVKSTTSVINNNLYDDDNEKQANEVVKSRLDAMSDTFRKIINKIKLKHKKIDMVFLVDSSSSVGKENFMNEISFVKRLLSDFNVSFNYTRVALITFSSKSKIHVHINQISEPSKENDKCILLNYQIPNITYSGGGTNTYSALFKAKEIFQKSKRKTSKKVLILITDGFSNGKNPIPIAQELKMSGVMIFTVGISSGNYDELRSLSSKPINNYNYMLSSFSLFESLARKALHTDYKIGVILPVSNSSFCDSLCDKNEAQTSCCDVNSQCACGFHSGHYSCICNPGYYGTGISPNGCDLCPNGSYWNFWNSCFNCPDINHETRKSPALSINDCVCKSGFKETQKNRCEVIKCPLLPVPDNGYFVHSSSCLNTVNTACGARCNSGYQLVGSSIRLCQEDGTWSGDETECVLKTCPALVIPPFGMAMCTNADLNMTIDYSPRNETFIKDYSVDVQKLTENFSIDTECEFSCAFGFFLVGSSKRHCLPLSKWDGLQTSCKQILCQPLPKIPFGSYNSQDCSDHKSSFSTNCTITCENGFEIKGPSFKVCGGTRNGVWTQKHKIPRCIDVTPPTLICPQNYSIELSQNKSYVLLAKFEPLQKVEDNSGTNVTFWVKPALKEGGTKMYIGNYTFTYVAVDDFKNKAKCNFSLAIVDKTPPKFENCITNQTFYVTSKNNTNQKIEWEEPFAYDNVDDKNVTVMKSLEHGFLNPGEYLVNYTALDNSGNFNSCLITVEVKEKKCDEPEIPENAQRVCAKNLTTTWCDFRCNFGYEIFENDTVIENVVLHCDNDEKIWSKSAGPECVVVEQPNSVEEILTISLNTEDMLCEDLAKNEEQLIKYLKAELCGDQECDLTTEAPKCVDESLSNEVSNSTFYSIVKRDVVSQPQKKVPNKQKNPGKFEIYVKISKNLGMWKPNSTKSENIKNVKEELKKVNASEKLKKRLRNMKVDLTVLKLDETIKCNSGSVSKKLVCVQCNRGLFHDEKLNECLPCPLATYSSLMGQTSCIQCPSYHSTRKVGSRQSTDCRQFCPPGTHARIKHMKKPSGIVAVKTLMPFCRTCLAGQYQPDYDQTTCIKCPNNLTSDQGSKTIESCYEKYDNSCTNKTCGDHGTCVTSRSFYSCECRDGFYGQNCELKQDQCSSSPCFNDGKCRSFNETDVTCDCPPGYHGDFCESVDDPCTQKNCQNGAVCNEVNKTATCECLPGFEGDSCERKILIDFCASSPCLNNGTCINKEDSFECICGVGSIGKRCHLMACDYKPCPGNAVCINLNFKRATKESYFCKCPKGLKGETCNDIDNPCEKLPCKNRAECSPFLLRDPKNVTTVEDETIYEKFSCKCPPFFYGERCELFTTPDFVLDFEKSSVNNYVKLSGPDHNLTELSFCSWIQTNDQFNYGSLISYASKDIDNAFTFTDYNGFVLYINGENIITDIKIIDDVWHFLCVSWTMNEGHYEIYVDGTLNIQGYNLSRSTPIAGEGIFIIGQEQDSLGGSFSESESFVGKISYMDFWDRQLNAIEINDYYRTCDPYQGNLFSWTDLKFKTVGEIKISQSEFCKPCEQNLTVDNGNVIYGDQTAFVICSEGFRIQGSPVVFCLRTSKWEQSKMPTCKIVKCNPLKTPTNGKLSLTKTSFKGQAKFTCDDGFDLIGSETITCNAKGNWSDDIPECKSIYECPALKAPSNGVLIYASDAGVIKANLSAYPVGTFVEINCNEGFQLTNENIVSCTDQGVWDFEVENCQPITTKTTTKRVKIPNEFWGNFRTFLFYSCIDGTEERSKLCDFYQPDFDTDLSSFNIPDTPEYKDINSNLYKLLQHIQESPDKKSLTAGNFLSTLLKGNDVSKSMRDSYRFMICFYIKNVIMIEDEDQESSENEDKPTDNDITKIKKLIKRISIPIYYNQLIMTETK